MESEHEDQPQQPQPQQPQQPQQPAAPQPSGTTGTSLGSGAAATSQGSGNTGSSLPFAASSPLRFSSEVSSPVSQRRAAPAGGAPATPAAVRTAQAHRPPFSSPMALTSDIGTSAATPRRQRPRAGDMSTPLAGGSSLGTQHFTPLFSGTPGSGTSRSQPGTPRGRRSFIRSSGALERYLAAASPAAASLSGAPLPTDPVTEAAAPSTDEPMTDPSEVRRLIWGTTVSIDDSMAMFRDFLLNFTAAHRIEHETGSVGTITDADRVPFYLRLLQKMRDTQQRNMNLDCANLAAYRPSRRLFDQLIRYPQEIIPLMDHVLTNIFLDKFEDAQLGPSESLYVRPYNIGRSVNMRELNPSDIDQLVTVKGLVIRTSPVLPDMKIAFFRCTSCGSSVEVENDRGQVKEPTVCAFNECKLKNSMRLVHNRCVFADKQICKLQETPDQTPDGQTPYTVSMCAYEDLVDVCKPGDRVEITGIFRGVPVRANPRRRAVKALFKTYLDVLHVMRTNKKRLGLDASIEVPMESGYDETDQVEDVSQQDAAQEEILRLAGRSDLYELLSRSIAPSIFGMEDVKKGVLLQLFGGSNKFSSGADGAPRIRGDINVLLVGDPGVSKSQLLQAVHKLAPRGIYTSGKGSSAVGLTAYVTRDPESRQLVLESGALVLSDGGVCCIDEFDKMSDYTRSVLHEVMEQQTISVAKAGIITTLNARTSILACANPINSKFDVSLSVPENVNLPPPLMSRFDLLYLLLDKPNEQNDRYLAKHLVGLYLSDRPQLSATEFVPVELFTKYINYAKREINPVITEQAGQALVNFYVSMRKAGSQGGSNVVTFTTRQLESMIRLSEAHAKMRLSTAVELTDVIEANRLVLAALQTAAIDPRTGRIDLDLVVTGISASERRARHDKLAALREMLQGLDKAAVRWAEAYRLFQSQSGPRVSENEFNSVLNDLVDEGAIRIAGRTNADKIIHRLQRAV